MRVADLLAERPFLAPILEFPPGWLVVLNEGTLEAVFDANGALRSCGGEMNPSATPRERPDDHGGSDSDRIDSPEARAE